MWLSVIYVQKVQNLSLMGPHLLGTRWTSTLFYMPSNASDTHWNLEYEQLFG